MLAAQAVGKGRLTAVETLRPECPEGGVLLKTNYASICGSDLHFVYFGLNTSWPMTPGAPGHESTGVVAESRANGFREGDRVLCAPMFWDSRCMAGWQAVKGSAITHISSAKPEKHQLMAQQLGTVIYAGKRMPSLFGKTVAVLGQGSAGLFWDFVLRRLGAERVIAFDPVPHRARLGTEFGADKSLCMKGDEAATAIMDMTSGQGADVVVEAVGSVPTLTQAFEMVRDQGLVVLFGLPESPDPVPWNHMAMFRKRASAFIPWGSQEEPGLASYRQSLDWINSGQIDMSPIATHILPLSKVQEGFDLAASRRDGVVKVTLAC
jgi:threonine dehydrogenase-like Zn-dependent dehydrogenase